MGSKDKNAKESGMKNETNEQRIKRKKAIELIDLWMKELENKELDLHEGDSKKNDK